MRLAVSLVIACSFASGAAGPDGLARPLAPQVPSGSQIQASAAPNYAFPSGAGMLFFYVKPDKTADFENVVARLADTLDRTDDPIRKQQAAGWRIMKSVETTKDSAIYVFIFDPAVSGADYDPVKVLSEKQPVDIQPLYEKLRDATIRVERMGLTKLR